MKTNRRQFIGGAGALAAASTFAVPGHRAGQAAASS